MLVEIINALWYMLPAYVANPAAVLFKGKTPMDFEKNFFDGRRILGKGKTWRGFFGGIFSGYIVGIIENIIGYFINNPYFPPFSHDLSMFIIPLVISAGSMIGDATGSFIKRRIGFESGSNAFLLDQYPFLLISLLFLYIFYPIEFFMYVWNLPGIITLIVITPLLHRAVNIIGFRIGKKDVPW